MKLLRPTLLLSVVGAILACTGGSPHTGTVRGDLPNPDIGDPAEIARLEREYARAEAMLKDRIKRNPDDHQAIRLLGDVNLTRGQDYRKKWRENLARAYDLYARAVKLQPENCSYWARTAGVVMMSYPNEQIRVPRTALDALPLDLGWTNCAGQSLLAIEMARDPAPEEVEAGIAKHRGDPWQQMNIASPWKKDAWTRTPLDQVSWTEGPGPAPLASGLPFVVLEPPLTAKGVGHTYHRPVKGIERFFLGRLSGEKAIFTDRRFPEEIPARAVVRANACKHTGFKSEGPDGVPVGTCSTSTFVRSKSPLYNPSVLKVAGPAHYSHPSIGPATIPGDRVIEGSVKCVGGPVGRKLEYTPTCPVTYSQPNYLTRWLPASKVVGAKSQAHADRMITAQGMNAVWTEGLSERMVRGDVGVDMPYTLFTYAFDDLKGCQGRALLARHRLNGGQLEWTCVLDDMAYTFVDLNLVWMGPPEAVGAQPEPETVP